MYPMSRWKTSGHTLSAHLIFIIHRKDPQPVRAILTRQGVRCDSSFWKFAKQAASRTIYMPFTPFLWKAKNCSVASTYLSSMYQLFDQILVGGMSRLVSNSHFFGYLLPLAHLLPSDRLKERASQRCCYWFKLRIVASFYQDLDALKQRK